MHRLVTANARAQHRKPGLQEKICVQAVTIASIEGHPLNSYCMINSRNRIPVYSAQVDSIIIIPANFNCIVILSSGSWWSCVITSNP